MDCIVFAAGKSSRFNHKKSKLLADFAGFEVINCALTAVFDSGLRPILILNYQRDQILETIERHFAKKVDFVVQENLLGTGHAFLLGSKASESDSVFAINGDCPLITSELMKNFVQFHKANKNDISVISAKSQDPFGYGRIVLQNQNHFEIIEEKDCDEEQKKINLINGGIYGFSKAFLQDQLNRVHNFLKSSSRSEIGINFFINQVEEKWKMGLFEVDFDLIRGVNTLEQLDEARKKVNKFNLD